MEVPVTQEELELRERAERRVNLSRRLKFLIGERIPKCVRALRNAHEMWMLEDVKVLAGALEDMCKDVVDFSDELMVLEGWKGSREPGEGDPAPVVDSGLRFREDGLFNEEVVREIERYHTLRYLSHSRHVYVDGMEIDVMAIFETKVGAFRRIFGFELKLYDLHRVVEQAVRRRYLFDYQYIVLDLPIRVLLTSLLRHPDLPEFIEKIKEHGIGIICENRIVLPSYFRKGSLRSIEEF